jgi:hypothetical protein
MRPVLMALVLFAAALAAQESRVARFSVERSIEVPRASRSP